MDRKESATETRTETGTKNRNGSIEALYEVAQYKLHHSGYENAEQLNHLRYTMEPYIYSYLMGRYMPVLEESWKNYLPPLEARHAFVLVERRPHPHFEFILKNIAWACPTMSVYLFCSDVNESFIRAILGDKAASYHIHPVFQGIGTVEKGKAEYNQFYTSATTYRMIRAEYMMTVQMDMFFRRKIPEDIFVGDYWGNPWAWKPDAAGGGGGTIRRVEKMIEICESGPVEENEDSWIADRITHYPPAEFRGCVFMESIPAHRPIAVHQFWTFLHNYIQRPREEAISLLQEILTLEG